MNDQVLRLLIRAKLSDGRLPHNSIPRVWGGSGNNETCDGCDETISKGQLVLEGIGADSRGVQFHVRCFHLWDSERQAPDTSPAIPASLTSDGAGATPAEWMQRPETSRAHLLG